MYYEEKVIDGILCWRGSPNSAFKQYTTKELTEKLIKATALINKLTNTETL